VKKTPKPPVALKGEARRRFLELFAEGNPIRHAARMVGTTAKTVHALARKDEGFKEQMELARVAFTERIQEEAVRRAVNGVQELVRDKDGAIVWERGSDGKLIVDPLTGDPVPAVVVRYSDRLLEVLLKGHHELFRERPMEVNVGVHQNGVLVVPGMAATAEEWVAKYAGGGAVPQATPLSPELEASIAATQPASPIPPAAEPKPMSAYERRQAEREASGIRLEKTTGAGIDRDAKRLSRSF